MLPGFQLLLQKEIGLLWIVQYICQPFFEYHRHPRNPEVAEDTPVWTAKSQLTCLLYSTYRCYCDFRFLVEKYN